MEVRGRDELASLGNSFNEMAQKLEDVDRIRSEFVSNASHELKTPLNSMKILTESILYEDNVEESVYKEFLGDIDHEVDRMTNLVNDMLLMTRLQNMEKKDLVFEEVSVISLLEMRFQKLDLRSSPLVYVKNRICLFVALVYQIFKFDVRKVN